MTTDLSHFTEEPLISIIGIGNDSQKHINEIKEWHSPLVSAKMLDRDFTGPEMGTGVAILVITENVDATVLAGNLKQSGLLTLIVSTCEIRATRGSYDSIAKVPEDKIMETVRTVVEILTKPSRHISLDYNDLRHLLKDSGKFQTFSCKSSVEKGGMTNLVNYLREKLKGLSSVEKMLVKITLSDAGKELLKMEDLTILTNFFSTLPDSIQVFWGLDTAEYLASDELAVSIIATVILKSKQ